MSNTNKVYVHSLGCKANFSDGQAIERDLIQQGLESTRHIQEADLIVINSCTVTDEAQQQSELMVKQMSKKNAHAKIIYTGCAAEVSPQDSLKIAGVSAVVGNQNKNNLAALVVNYLKTQDSELNLAPVILGSVTRYDEIASRHPLDREWSMPEIDHGDANTENFSTDRTRAFLKIQEGCNSFCTYCIIPYGRGPARSLPIEAIVSRIQELVAQGIQEVVLTGTNIGEYGLDWSDSAKIDDLIEAILVKSNLARLRVGSLDPTEISERLIQLMESHERFCPHFHVSLQHVDHRILKLMKRKYQFEDVLITLNRLSQMKRKPFVGVDYIVGFPGETNEIFEQSVATLQSLYWTRLHVFPYSERTGTPATKLPGVIYPHVRKERAKVLQSLSLDRLKNHFTMIRRSFVETSKPLIQQVLLEGATRGPDGTRDWVAGYSKDYQRVLFPKTLTPITAKNTIVNVEVQQWVMDRASGDVSWLAQGIQS